MLKFLLCFDVKFLKIYDRTNTQGNRLAESSVINGDIYVSNFSNGCSYIYF